MIMKRKDRINTFYNRIFSDRSARTALIKKNVCASFLIKGWSGLMQMILVPLTLGCLDVYENGVWLIISSMLIWIDNMDIGLGNGLRNKLAEAIAVGDSEKARGVVSSTFVMLIAIILPVVVIINLFVANVDIYSLLNVDRHIVTNLNAVISVSVLLVGITFIFKFIGNFYMGMQMPAVNNLLVTLGQTFAVVGTFLLMRLGIHSLIWVSVVNTLAPLIVYLMSYPVTFSYKYPQLRPSLRSVSKELIKGMFSMGCKFFVLQISSILLFMSLNVIISKCFSPAMVTPYQVAYRYFCLAQMIFFIISGPYWTATSDAYKKNDREWIQRSGKTLDKIVIVMAFLIVVMIVASDFVYSIWVGDKVLVPFHMTLLVAAYLFILLVSNRYSIILNGMGKLRLQLIVTVSAALAFVPLAVLIGRITHSLNYLLVFMCAINMPGLVINYIQYEKILMGKASGIWMK